MIGLTGAHRSGKSTLAVDLSKTLNIPFHPTSAGEIMKQGGYDSVSNMSMEQRFKAQAFLLERYCEIVSGFKGPFIVDRTPIDFAAYTLAEVTMLNTPGDLSEQINAYVQICFERTDTMFDILVYTKPLPFYVEENGKPPADLAYQKQIDLLIGGMLDNDVAVDSLKVNTSNHTRRVNEISAVLAKRLMDITELRQSSQLH